MQLSSLQLFLFGTDVRTAQVAEQAGIDNIIVDWENQGKYLRQKNYDTQINRHTLEDLTRTRAAVKTSITVRVNGGAAAFDEADRAIEHGANVIMLPMARTARDVEVFLKHINGRAKTLIQIETQSLFEQVGDLQGLDWDYSFIGLNDLMISRGQDWLWTPLLDGTVERIFEKLPGRQIGFGGVTIIGGGYPLPFLNLLHEFSRLGCSLSFLRRTFSREIEGRNFSAEIEAVRAVWKAAMLRSPVAVEEDFREFRGCLERARVAAARPIIPARLAS